MGGSLKSWGAIGVAQTLHSSELGNWGFFPNCNVLCQGWDLWQEFVSAFTTYFYVSIFSVAHSVRVSQLIVSELLSEGIAPHVAVYSVHLYEERNSRASNVSILVMS